MAVQSPKKRPKKPVIGWREWVALPDLGVDGIKVKVDTGARTSALHAFQLKRFRRDDQDWVRFTIHPRQRDTRTSITVELPVAGERVVRNTSGRQERRQSIVTTVELMGRRWPIELTLARRDEMGFRMLLGRSAVRRFLVDPGRSFVAGKPSNLLG